MWIAKDNVKRLLELADRIIEDDGRSPWFWQFTHLLAQYKRTPRILRNRWAGEVR